MVGLARGLLALVGGDRVVPSSRSSFACWVFEPLSISSIANMAKPSTTTTEMTIATKRISDPIGSTIGSRVPNPDPRETLVAELREHALVIGEVTLTSGHTAQYYVDAKRAILLPAGFRALGELVRAEAERAGATAVGGMTMGADPVACAALAAGADVKAFFVRKERKQHGLQRWVEGPCSSRASAA